MRWLLMFAVLVALPHGLLRAESTITAFDTTIEVFAAGNIQVREHIDYDFGTSEQHGIYRVIPYSYQASSTTYVADIVDVSVQDGNGSAIPFVLSRGNGELELKIGDPDKKVTGEQTYEIAYTVEGPFLGFEEHDELYWNVTGSWRRTIEQASVAVVLPAGVPVLEVSCYQGMPGARSSCDVEERLQQEGRAGYFASARGLSPGAGLTIAVAFPKGVVTLPTKPWQESLNARAGAYSYGVILVLLLVLVGVGYRWYTRGRDPKGRGSIIPEYEPPVGVSPAIAGIVYNERIEPRELSAEIVQLAVKGYLTIHRLEEEGLVLTRTDYLFERNEKHVPEDAFQLLLLEKLFSAAYSGKAHVHGVERTGALLSKMEHAFTADRDELVSVLYDMVQEEGYFLERPDKIRIAYGMIGGLIAALSITPLLLWSVPAMLRWSLVAGIVSGVIVAVVGYAMPARTRRGVEVKEHLEGFKRYLAVAEKDRMAFHDAPERTPEQFSTYLPYAMALGVEKAWAKQFEHLHLSAPAWYTDPAGGTFAPTQFATALEGFSTDFSAASMPRSSGVSGGGHVGGGFGGGRGGSW